MAKRFTASGASPLSWWLLAIAMAIAAGVSQNALTQVLVCLLALITILLFREDAPWSRSVRFYLFLAGFVVVARVLFRIVFNIQNPEESTALALPGLSINLGFGPTVELFGAVSHEALLGGATDGLRLAAIILSIGMASSLANPRTLLKSTPSALYEIASAISVAINLAPQMISSLQRVRKARSLRGRSKGLGSMAGTVIPVLEDAIDSSLALAASMDSRGFGRRGDLSKSQVLGARLSSLVAVALLAIGSFTLLIGQTELIGGVLIAFGLLASLVTVRINSKAQIRTRFESATFGVFDIFLVVISCALLISAALGWLP
jgi:energy-coupling factor transport system permease protein